MTSTAEKRKAASVLHESAKRLRVAEPLNSSDQLPLPTRPALESSKASAQDKSLNLEDDDAINDYKQHISESSDEDEGADTPITPFSPTRKKFPSELKTIKCTWEGCTKTFNRPARLTAHLRSHTNERPYVCTYEGCDKAYLTDKHLQTHIKGSHTHERSYHCDWDGCTKSFLTSTRLKRHKEAHKGHERFRCTAYPPCNQTFRKHQTLQRHIRSEHLELAPYPCTYIDPITGETCNAGFDGAVGLRKHEERVHGAAQFFCPQCTVSGVFALDGTPIHLGFTTDTKLQSHIKKEHANCPFCDLKCSSQRELQNHIDSQHSGKTLEERKTIYCTYLGCDKSFTKPGNLKIHIRTAHMGERYICCTFDLSSHPDVGHFDKADACGKDFVSKASLVDHIRTAHLGLPSVVNGNRKKPASSEDEFETNEGAEEDEEEEYIEQPKKKAKKQSKNVILAVMNDMLCVPDPSASLPTFERAVQPSEGYDLSFNSGFAGGIGEEQGRQEMDALYDQADIDWELQQRALEGGGAFWIGAEEEQNNFRGDQADEWTQEEMEMRRLVGDV